MANVKRAAWRLLWGLSGNQAHDREDAAVEPKEAAPTRSNLKDFRTRAGRSRCCSCPGPSRSGWRASQCCEGRRLCVGERLTKYIPARYAGMRARVQARAAPEKAKELGRVLAGLCERLGK